MKKSLLIALGALCIAGLAGCRGGEGGTTSYGAEVEAAAIKRVVEGNLATVNGSTPLIPSSQSELNADDNDDIRVIVKQLVPVNGVKAEVIVEWSYDEANASHVNAFRKGNNDNIKVFDLVYPGVGEEATSFTFTATPKCGATTGDAVSYTVALSAATINFPGYKLSEILSLNEAGTCFAHVTDADKGYWESNNEQTGEPYMYITTYGKVTYLAPDGNWGIIADGNLFLEIYSGNALNLKPSEYPDLVVGNWVAVRGEMGHYKGNVQLSYISSVRECEQGTMTEPADYKTIDEAYLNSYQQFNGDMNAYVSVTGTYAGGASPAISSWNSGSRMTFNMNVGSKTLVIAYDYHTSKEDSSTLYAEMKALLGSLAEGSSITVKGTLRFVTSSDGKSGVFTNQGTCQVTPFLPGHVVAA